MTSGGRGLSELSREERRALFGKLREHRDKTGSTGGPERIPRRPVDAGPAPLSFAQQRLWFLDRLQPGHPAYNVPVAVRLSGPLDPKALARALEAVASRQEALRTTFTVSDRGPVQVVAHGLDVPLPVVDLTGRDDALVAALQLEAARSFDLEEGPLLRAHLARLGPQDHVLLLTMHHIVSDGASMAVLVREAVSFYEAFVSGRPVSLPALPIQYSDFAFWQRERFQGAHLEEQISYWKERLAGAPAVLDLPTDHPRPARQSLSGRDVRFEAGRAAAQGARALAREAEATPFAIALGAFLALLQRWTGEEDLCIGTAVAGRDRPELAGLVGFFVNTLVLRGDLSGDPPFRTLLARLRETLLGAFSHQELPFEKLVEELQPERDPSRPPLVQVMLVLQNNPVSQLEAGGLEIRPVRFPSETAKLDLTLTLDDGTEAWAGSVQVSSALFERSTAFRFAEHFRNLLASAVADPDRRLSDLALLSEAESHQLLIELSGRPEPQTSREMLWDLFQTWAEQTPEAPAVTGEGETLTYGEVARRANRLAAALTGWGVGPEVPVTFCLDRSPELIVVILAVLRAGGAYVPLDPTHPGERLAWALEDSKAPLLLTRSSLRAGWMEKTQARVVFLDEADLPESPVPAPTVDPKNLAYVIYTSGSTGRPKGVGVTHANAVQLLRQTEGWFGFGPEDVWTLFHSPAFDFSVWEMWGALAYGGRLVVVPYWVSRSPEAFQELLVRERVTVLNQTPSAFGQLLPVLLADVTPGLRWVIFGGEALDPRNLQSWFESYEDRKPRLVNMYGITETTVHVTFRRLSREDAEGGGGASPIGRGIPDLSVHVLDRQMRPVPLGAHGEIYVGGAGLGRAYLRRPDLTADRFIPDPFSPDPGQRLYRTGDLARRLPDSCLDFLGRRDHQVKIRGFRIELGEVEAALRFHPDVRDAVVLLNGEGDSRRLVAFLTSSDPPPSAILRGFLQERLTEPMIPAAFVALDRLPVTANGKVDRAALAQLASGASRSQDEYLPPRGPVQEVLAGLWEDLLGIPRVGAQDSFFELGGHSLLAVQLVSRVRDHLRVELPLQAVFEEPVLARLAARIGFEDGAEPLPALRPVPRRDGEGLPLSFAQERMWFLQQLDPGATVYNIPLALRMEGEPRLALLDAALRSVVERHEALRSRFRADRGEPVQAIGTVPEHLLAEVDLRALPESLKSLERDRLAAGGEVRPFDLESGPLLRSALVRVAATESILLLDQHHIVSDGWSLGVLVREVAALYRERQASLPALPVQYADYTVWQRENLLGSRLDRYLAYWRDRLADPPKLQLPTDRPRTAVPTVSGATRTFVLPVESLAAVEALGRRRGATLFMVGLAAFYALLARYTGQDDLAVGSVSANRDRSEIEGLIGFFVNTLVLRTGLAGDPSFSETLERTRQTTLEAFAHQGVPFEKLVAELRPERDLSRTPLFQVMFVLQNAPVEPLEIPGLKLVPLETPRDRPVQFELSWSLRPGLDGLAVTVEHARSLFEAATVERMAGHFQNLLTGAVAEPGQRLSDLPMLAPTELSQILTEWSTLRPLSEPEPILLHQLIEEQASRSPQAPAVEADGLSLTYAELRDRANRLARHLRRLGVGPEVRVGLAAERVPETLVGILAVLQAGGAYVPLDPAYPTERLSWMMEDAGLSLLLLKSDNQKPFPVSPHRSTLILDGLLDRGWLDESPAPPDWPAPDPRNAAYVLYTSGSTGVPKGVVIEHRSIAAYTLEAREAYRITARDRVLQFASLSFDTSAEEIFPALAAGACLVLRPPDMAGTAEHFFGEMERLRISFLALATAYWHELVQGMEKDRLSPPRDLRMVAFGGEEARPERLADWRRRVGTSIDLINGYGPTEATIVATRADLTADAEVPVPDPVPIGRPIDGACSYVVDRFLVPVPAGVPGELLVGGAGLGRGYLNRPDLTAERFVPDPWSGSPGARLYRTGDRVRWRPDGTLDYLGRSDDQVKVRGYRVEPIEVAAALERHPDVGAAVVVPWSPPGAPLGLAAYVVPAGEEVSVEALRSFLADRLPPAMVPSAFTVLPSLPLNPSGKVDRHRLPAPERQAAASFVPPSSELERELAEVWAEVLSLDRVGAHDNLFDLGGHSLLLPRIQSRVRERLGLDLPLLKLFEHPTVGSLAAYLERSEVETGLDSESRGRALRQRRGLEAQRQRMSGRRVR